MSLIKQLWLAVLTATCFAFSGSILVSLMTAQKYLEEQLSIKNNDNANTLALAMSQLPKDNITIELQVSAMFDSGQYALIKVSDPNGKTIIEKKSTIETGDSPKWFTELFPIQSNPGVSQITEGWRQFGSIEIISHSQYAYNELWAGCLKLIGWFILGAIISGYGCVIFLKQITAPLNDIVRQAILISEKQFIKVTESKIPELAVLSHTMNLMMEKIKLLFDEEAKRLDLMRNEGTLDTLTKISNRKHFFNQLYDLTKDENNDGFNIFLLRIINLERLNTLYGREKTDHLIKCTSEILREITKEGEGILGRLNGADFCFSLPRNTDPKEVKESINKKLEGKIKTNNISNIKTILISTFHSKKHDLPSTFSNIDHALHQNINEATDLLTWQDIRSQNERKLDSNALKNILKTAIENKKVKLVEYKVCNRDGVTLHEECPIRIFSNADNQWLTPSTFFQVALKMNIVGKVDLLGIEAALQKIQDTKKDIAVNISGHSLLAPEFEQKVIHLLKTTPKEITEKLWIEISEKSSLSSAIEFKTFFSKLKNFSVKLGIEHFGRELSKISLIHELGIDYLKVDGSFIHEIDSNIAHQSYLGGLAAICHKLEIVVIAENVSTEGEKEKLFALGFDAITGPIIK